jgi:Na+-transporting NADH:ubiquinone oxidoreductase subunit NqrF
MSETKPIVNLANSSKIYTKEGLLKVIDALPMAIAIIDKSKNVILANKMTYKFANKNEEQLIGSVGGDALGCVHHNDVPEGCGFGEACLKCKLREIISDTMVQKKLII